MAVDLIGYRFSPTKEELVNDYLKNKNLGKSWLVDHAINEINLCSFEPKDLPALSKIQSDDLVWYFFSPIVYANAKKTTMKRTAGKGFWKPTGKDRIIKDKKGSKIGIKKTLVYHQGKSANGVRTPWVIHEYHITYLPPNKTTYVLCQVKYKGDHTDMSYGSNDSVVSHSDIGREINTVPEAVQVDQQVDDGLYLNDLSYPLNVQEDLNPNLLQKTPKDQVNQPVQDVLTLNDLSSPLNIQDDLNPNQLQESPEVQVLECLSLDDLEMPENKQDDLPPPDAFDPNTFFNLPPQTPYDDNYWNDFISYEEGKSSPHDSVASSNKHFPRCPSTDSCNDLQTSADLLVRRKTRECQLITRPTIRSRKEVKRDKSRDKETSMVKTEKKSCFTIKKAIGFYCKKPRLIYLMNMITGFILLVGLIGYIKS